MLVWLASNSAVEPRQGAGYSCPRVYCQASIVMDFTWSSAAAKYKCQNNSPKYANLLSAPLVPASPTLDLRKTTRRHRQHNTRANNHSTRLQDLETVCLSSCLPIGPTEPRTEQVVMRQIQLLNTIKTLCNARHGLLCVNQLIVKLGYPTSRAFYKCTPRTHRLPT